MQDTPLIIGSRSFQSRLLVGTGKYKDLNETDLAIQASGAEIVTVAIRRVNIGQNQINRIYFQSSHQKNIQFCQIPQVVLMLTAQYAHAC